ncbi:MAG TPA: GH25 family lysozyme [Ohtaekwangia sp.]
MKRLLIAIVEFSGLVVLLGYLLYDGRIRFNYPDKEEFPVVGIDISHHQGKINWKQLSTEDVSFIIMKATEGVDYKDPLFDSNWSASKSAGYKTGAYHFYRVCRDGKEQAENFIRTVPNLPENIAPTIDLEFGGNCKN